MSNKWTADGAQPDVVSYWYFEANVATWFMTPLVFMLFSSWFEMQFWFTKFMDVNGVRRDTMKTCHSCHPIIRYPVRAIAAYLLSVLMVYIVVPLYDIYLGFRNVFCHKSYKDGSGNEIHSEAPAMKVPEQLGEAIPQFLVAVVFYAKNYHWLSPWEIIKGGVTMFLSCGSILFGVVCGLKVTLNHNHEVECEYDC